MTGLPVPQVPTCGPPPQGERLEADSKPFTQCSSRLFHPSLLLLHVTSGRDDRPGKDRGPGGSGKGSAVLPSMLSPALPGSSAPAFQDIRVKKPNVF